MYVNQSGTGYQVYVQSSYHYKKIKESESSVSYDKSIDSFFKDVQNSIPELKGVSEGDVNIHVLPDANTNSNQNTINQQKFKNSDILGIYSYNYSIEGDYSQNGSTLNGYQINSEELFDISSVKAVKDKLDIMYGSSNDQNVQDELYFLNEVTDKRGVFKNYEFIPKSNKQKAQIEKMLEDIKNNTQNTLLSKNNETTDLKSLLNLSK